LKIEYLILNIGEEFVREMKNSSCCHSLKEEKLKEFQREGT